MSKDIIKRGDDTYQIVWREDEFGEIHMGLIKNDERIYSYSVSVTSETASAHRIVTGTSIIPGLIQAIAGDIEEGKFDQV